MAGTQIRGGLAAIAALSTAAAVHAGPGPTPLYVDAAAPPGGNGSSWSQAFRDLQDALALAKLDPNPAKQYDIRVAQGVYTPDRGTGNRAMAFLVASGMTLTGGYAGMNAANPDLRDPAQFVSVLSGDLGRNDGPGFANTSENSYRILRLEPPYGGREITVDGFTIRGGNGGNTHGGSGVYATGSSAYTVNLTSCIVRDNQSAWGGGIVGYANLRIDKCVIESNLTIANGGGLWGWNVIITDSVVQRNSAFTGGGMHVGRILATRVTIADNNSGGVEVDDRGTFTNCIIAGNVHGSKPGGGVHASGSEVSLLSCFIGHNVAESGGAVAARNGAVNLTSCTIVSNFVWGQGAAITAGAPSSIANCIVANNSSPVGSVATITSGLLNVRRSLIPGGAAGFSPPGMVVYDANNINGTPQFVNSVGSNTDLASWRDKDYRLRPTSLGIDAADSGFWPGAYEDVAGRSRFVDILVAPNTGIDTTTFLDIGAYETQPLCPADFDGSGQVAIDDLFHYLNAFFTNNPAADTDGVGGVSIDDLFQFFNFWFRGC